MSRNLSLVVLVSLAILAASAPAAHAQALDSFAPNTNGPIYAMAAQEDGAVLIGGDFTTVAGVTRDHIARVLPSGAIDENFDPNATGPVYAILVQPDGRIVIGGSFSKVGICGGWDDACYTNLARLNPDGSLDKSFKWHYPRPDIPVTGFALQLDDKVLVVSDSSFVVRVNADGSGDDTFLSAGYLQLWTPYPLRSVAVQPDGKILLAGGGGIMRLNPDGTADPSFGTAQLNLLGEPCTASDTNCVTVTPVDDTINAIAVASDGKILVGGRFIYLGGSIRQAFGRLNPDGTLYSETAPRAFDPHAVVQSLAVRADGLILVGGQNLRQAVVGGEPVWVTLQGLNADGTRDDDYVQVALHNNWSAGSVYALAIEQDWNTWLVGKFVVGGAFDNLSMSASRSNIGRLTTATPATQQISFDVTTGQLTWYYGGSYPEATWARFEYSTDRYGTYAPYVTATRIPGGWTATIDPHVTGWFRAVGYYGAGQYDGSGGVFSSWGVRADNAYVSSTTVTAPPGVWVGKPITLTATVSSAATPDAPTGTVTFLEGGVAIAGCAAQPLTSGQATCAMSFATNGSHEVTASYSGAPRFLPSVSEAAVVPVTGSSTTTTLASSPNPSTAAQPATFTATVRPVGGNGVPSSGSVTFFDGATSLGTSTLNAAGVATLSTTALTTSGKHSITAQFAGTPDYGASTSAAFTQKVVIPPPPPDSFNPNAGLDVLAIALQPDGKIVAGGYFTTLGGATRNHIGRLDAGGTLDADFNPGADHVVRAVAVQPDGKILVGGEFATLGSQARSHIGRLNADGTLDTSFDPGADQVVWAFAVQPDGKILVGGSFTSLGGQARNHVARLNANGTVDPSFDPGADPSVLALFATPWADDGVHALAVQPDGSILMASGNGLVRLNADGTPDWLTVDLLGVYSVAVRPDGKILAGGSFGIVRLEANGSADAGFTASFPSGVFAMALQADGRILAGGNFDFVQRLNPDGSVDYTEPFGTTNPYGTSYALAIQPDGMVVVGGHFLTLGDQDRGYIGRLTNDTEASQQMALDTDTGQLTWTRGGSSPELTWVAFESSTDGSNWSALSPVTRVGGGWTVTVDQAHMTGTYRALGYFGTTMGSGSVVSTVLTETQSPAITSPASATFSVGTAGTFTVTATGHPTPTLGEDATDTLPTGLGFDAGTGVLSGTTAQAGTFTLHFTASNGATPDAHQTFTLIVTPKALASLTISPASATVKAGLSQLYAATGFDQYGNSLGDVTGATTFTVTNGTCTANACTSTKAGPQVVTGNDSGKTATASLTVTPGSVYRVTLSPAFATITAGGSVTYKAEGFDYYGNDTGDVTSATTFTISPGGSCTANTCTTTQAGGPHVSGHYNGIATTDATIKVNPGPLAAISLSPASAAITAGGKSSYTALAFDQYDNPIGDATATTTFTVTNGICDANSCTSTVAGTQTVTGKKSGIINTATLKVDPGPLASVTISPASATIKAGLSQIYAATGFDQYDNSLGDVTSSTTFGITPELMCTGRSCIANKTGAHTVSGTISGKTATASLTVIPGAVYRITLSPASATITAGSSVIYTAEGFDHFGNDAGDVTGGTTFTISPGGSCTAKTCTSTAAGTQTVTGSNGGVTNTASLKVNPGPLASLTISPASETITAGGKSSYTALAFDQYGNSRGDVTGATTFTVTHGSCDANACTGTVAGTQTVTGSNGGFTDTATLNVLPGTITHLALAPAVASIAPGANQSYAAQGLDAFGNPAGDVTSSTTFTINSPGSCAGVVCTSNATGPYSVTGTCTNGAQGTASLTVTAGTFTRLQLLLPGETAAPGTISGKTGNPSIEYVNGAFDVTVNAVDDNWNLVGTVTDTVQIASSDTRAQLPPNAALVAGTGKFSVTLQTVSDDPALTTITASDLTQTGIADGQSPVTQVIVVYTAGISPTAWATGEKAMYTLTVNNAPSPNAIYLASVEVAVPATAQGTVSEVTAPANWTYDASLLPEKLRFVANSPDVAVIPGGAITITFTATSNATVDASSVPEVWRTTAFSDVASQDPLPIAPPEPTVRIGSAPKITSANSTNAFAYGAAGATFDATTTGVPTPSLSAGAGLPGWAVFKDNGNGTATISGSPAAAGPSTFTVTAHSGYGSDATQSFTLTVDPATLTVTAENTSRPYGQSNPSFTAAYTGFVNGETTAVLSGAPALATTATSSSNPGTYPITPTQGTLHAANYTFAFVAGTLSVVNRAPTADSQSVSTDQDSAKAITLTGSDPDGNAITYAVTTLPVHGALTGAAPAVTYTPAPGYCGADGFTFAVTDAAGAVSITAAVAITVNHVNHAPVANSQSVQVLQNTRTAVTLTGSDPDGDALRYSVVAPPAHGTLSGTAPALSYTPNFGYTGPDKFSFKVNDGSLDSAPATVSISVVRPQPPKADSQTVATDQGQPVVITLTGTAPSGGTLTFTVVKPPSHGRLSGSGANLTYTPASGYSGTDSFTFVVSDGHLSSPCATVTIVVNRVNHPPVANPQSVTVDQNCAKSITLTGSDTDGDRLGYLVLARPSHGTLGGIAPNLTYIPSPGYSGPDSFTFEVNDGTVDSAPATVSITVVHTNHAPVAYGSSVTTTVNKAVTGTLVAKDADGDALSYSVVSTPKHGTVTLNPVTGGFTFKPNANWRGTDSFTFRASDGTANSNTATVSINVR